MKMRELLEKTLKINLDESGKFYLNVNYHKGLNQYFLRMGDGRTSAQTDEAGFTQELRNLGLNAEEIIKAVKEHDINNGMGSLVIKVRPEVLQKSGISFIKKGPLTKSPGWEK